MTPKIFNNKFCKVYLEVVSIKTKSNCIFFSNEKNE